VRMVQYHVSKQPDRRQRRPITLPSSHRSPAQTAPVSALVSARQHRQLCSSIKPDPIHFPFGPATKPSNDNVHEQNYISHFLISLSQPVQIVRFCTGVTSTAMATCSPVVGCGGGSLPPQLLRSMLSASNDEEAPACCGAVDNGPVGDNGLPIDGRKWSFQSCEAASEAFAISFPWRASAVASYGLQFGPDLFLFLRRKLGKLLGCRNSRGKDISMSTAPWMK